MSLITWYCNFNTSIDTVCDTMVLWKLCRWPGINRPITTCNGLDSLTADQNTVLNYLNINPYFPPLLHRHLHFWNPCKGTAAPSWWIWSEPAAAPDPQADVSPWTALGHCHCCLWERKRKKERGRRGRQREKEGRGREGDEWMGCRMGWGERAFKSGCKERESRKGVKANELA